MTGFVRLFHRTSAPMVQSPHSPAAAGTSSRNLPPPRRSRGMADFREFLQAAVMLEETGP